MPPTLPEWSVMTTHHRCWSGEFSALLLWWLPENAVDAMNVAHKRWRRSYFPSSAFGSTCPKCSILAQLIFLKSSPVHAFYSYSILHSLRIWPRRCFCPDLLRRWKGPSKQGWAHFLIHFELMLETKNQAKMK
ncbi:uncharacterized protein G2W53_032763 [Senna tora]|uniref:Uncharacterized protein n=1 Tax=Senna tora TaxID=362788 RepID=A0A834T114_9FABA|nr:uncharacterized protein G2W53_032763 [Senna tora]